MHLLQRSHIAVGSGLLGLALATAAVSAQHDMIVVKEAQWQPAPPFLPPGAQFALLEGNRAEKGDITLRLKLPDNYRLPPHWHSTTEHVTVLSGNFNIGMGDTINPSDTQQLRPGGYVSLPAKMHHYAVARGETIVQVHLQGPFDIYYVNPGDDPQKQAVSSQKR